MEKEWIRIQSLDEIERPSAKAFVVLLESKNGFRVCAHAFIDTRGNYRLRGYDRNKMKRHKILAYYGISSWEFCLVPYSSDTKIPCINSKHNCDAYTLWGNYTGGYVPIEHQIVRVLNGHPIFEAGEGKAPNVLLGYHILPDIYRI